MCISFHMNSLPSHFSQREHSLSPSLWIHDMVHTIIHMGECIKLLLYFVRRGYDGRCVFSCTHAIFSCGSCFVIPQLILTALPTFDNFFKPITSTSHLLISFPFSLSLSLCPHPKELPVYSNNSNETI